MINVRYFLTFRGKDTGFSDKNVEMTVTEGMENYGR